MARESINTPYFGPIADMQHFAQGVKSNGMLYSSGMIGVDIEKEAVPENAEDEFRIAFTFLKDLLAEAGLTFDDVIEMTTFHVKPDSDEVEAANNAAFGKVKDEFMGSEPPYCAWTGIGISGLAMPGARVEVKIIAKLKD